MFFIDQLYPERLLAGIRNAYCILYRGLRHLNFKSATLGCRVLLKKGVKRGLDLRSTLTEEATSSVIQNCTKSISIAAAVELPSK